jgi:hypothetical protein
MRAIKIILKLQVFSVQLFNEDITLLILLPGERDETGGKKSSVSCVS